MSGAFALDASVVAKLFVMEPDTPRAFSLTNSGARLIAPSHLAMEVSSAITRRHRQGGITRVDAEAALTKASLFFSTASVELSPDQAVLGRAEEIALDIKHALKDCLYVALAERERCELITADATLLTRAQPHFPFVKPL